MPRDRRSVPPKPAWRNFFRRQAEDDAGVRRLRSASMPTLKISSEEDSTEPSAAPSSSILALSTQHAFAADIAGRYTPAHRPVGIEGLNALDSTDYTDEDSSQNLQQRRKVLSETDDPESESFSLSSRGGERQGDAGRPLMEKGGSSESSSGSRTAHTAPAGAGRGGEIDMDVIVPRVRLRQGSMDRRDPRSRSQSMTEYDESESLSVRGGRTARLIARSRSQSVTEADGEESLANYSENESPRSEDYALPSEDPYAFVTGFGKPLGLPRNWNRIN